MLPRQVGAVIVAFLVAIGILPPHLSLAAQLRVLVATNFDVPDRDPWNPRGELACAPGRQLDRVTPVVAHRTLPCGSRVLLYAPRTGRSVIATVADRGPYGRNRHGIDLSAATARALRANGEEAVLVVPLGAHVR